MNTAHIDQLRGQPTETEWLEFKRNRYEPKQLGEYSSPKSFKSYSILH